MDWIYSPKDPLLETIAGSIMVLIIVLVITRIVGLRSFAKFTVFDFAFTVAIGSIISSTLTSSTSIAQGGTAIACLLLITLSLSYLQRKSTAVDKMVSNKPLLLMDGNTILDKNLAHARVQRSQLIAKLREANVLNFDQVHAVVLESTGDISVLHGTDEAFDKALLDGVRTKP